MKKKKTVVPEPGVTGSPSVAQLEQELHREKYRNRYLSILRSTFFTLIVVAAVSVLVATLILPVLQIYGDSMSPTLTADEIVVTVKTKRLGKGDIIAFYHNNHILVKRIIAGGGQIVDIDGEGNVTVDGVLLEEPYVTEKSAGTADIVYPYQVPENTYFVMGDHRETSADSRTSAIGCVNSEEILGKIVFTVWPLKGFGKVQ